MREIFTLQCSVCASKNYTSKKDKRKSPAKLELNKFCHKCKKHTLHKEVK